MDPVNQIYSMKSGLSLMTREGSPMFLKYCLPSMVFIFHWLRVGYQFPFLDLSFLICKMTGLVHCSLKVL